MDGPRVSRRELLATGAAAGAAFALRGAAASGAEATWSRQIDFGPEVGQKRSSAQITHYSREQLEGRLVVAVTNFAPKRIAGFKSECLVLGALNDENGVVLLRPDEDAAAPGDRIA